MSTQKPESAAEHVARAKEELTRDGGAQYAIAHALVAIADVLVEVPNHVNEAMASLLNGVTIGTAAITGPAPQHPSGPPKLRAVDDESAGE